MCYAVPLSGALVTSFLWNKNKNMKIWWLNLMFWGGAIFGVVDHLWNGELFFISSNIINDLMLGLVITLVILLGWLIPLVLNKDNPALTACVNIKK